MLKERMSYLIYSCDAYSDLWQHNHHFLVKSWKGRDVDSFLVTDKETDKTLETVKILCAGEGTEMSERTAYALPYINTEYVLVTLDDYFPVHPIHNERLERLLDIMDREKIDYLRLFPDPNSHKKWKGYDGLYHIPLDKNYDVNLYQGIWRRSFLEKTVGQPLNAWQYEVTLTRIAKKEGAVCALSKGGEYEILDVIRKGKLLHRAKRYLAKEGITIPTRETIAYKEEMRIYIYNHGKKILPKPLAKLVKNFLRKRGKTFFSESI
ncbi:MAG: hypothetical protein IJA52_04025 [Clostridia bacterium]|nr:hypothetical protein [Clostridia bacterium]